MGLHETRRAIRYKKQQFTEARDRLSDRIHEKRTDYRESLHQVKARLVGEPAWKAREESWRKGSSVLPSGTKVNLEVHVQEADAAGQIQRRIVEVYGVKLKGDQRVRNKGASYFTPYSQEHKDAQEEAREAEAEYYGYLRDLGQKGDYREDVFEEVALKHEMDVKNLIVAANEQSMVHGFMSSVPDADLPFDRAAIRAVDISKVGRIWPHRSSELPPRETWRDRLSRWNETMKTNREERHPRAWEDIQPTSQPLHGHQKERPHNVSYGDQKIGQEPQIYGDQTIKDAEKNRSPDDKNGPPPEKTK